LTHLEFFDLHVFSDIGRGTLLDSLFGIFFYFYFIWTLMDHNTEYFLTHWNNCLLPGPLLNAEGYCKTIGCSKYVHTRARVSF